MTRPVLAFEGVVLPETVALRPAIYEGDDGMLWSRTAGRVDRPTRHPVSDLAELATSGHVTRVFTPSDDPGEGQDSELATDRPLELRDSDEGVVVISEEIAEACAHPLPRRFVANLHEATSILDRVGNQILDRADLALRRRHRNVAERFGWLACQCFRRTESPDQPTFELWSAYLRIAAALLLARAGLDQLEPFHRLVVVPSYPAIDLLTLNRAARDLLVRVGQLDTDAPAQQSSDSRWAARRARDLVSTIPDVHVQARILNRFSGDLPSHVVAAPSATKRGPVARVTDLDVATRRLEQSFVSGALTPAELASELSAVVRNQLAGWPTHADTSGPSHTPKTSASKASSQASASSRPRQPGPASAGRSDDQPAPARGSIRGASSPPAIAASAGSNRDSRRVETKGSIGRAAIEFRTGARPELVAEAAPATKVPPEKARKPAAAKKAPAKKAAVQKAPAKKAALKKAAAKPVTKSGSSTKAAGNSAPPKKATTKPVARKTAGGPVTALVAKSAKGKAKASSIPPHTSG